MWWKKLLYYLLVVVLGIGITTLSGSIAFNALSKNVLKEASQHKEYAKVESFFNYVSVKDEEKFLIDDQNDIHYEIYPALVNQPYFKKNGAGEYYVKYDIVEEVIGFSFFNIPKEFSYKEKETKAEILLKLSNGNDYHIYVNNVGNDEEAANFHIDFSDFVDQYYSLNMYVTYNDFINVTESEEISITAISLIDGHGKKFIEKSLEKNINFNADMFVLLKEACQKYREYILQYGEAHSVTTYERKNALLDNINKIVKDNSSRFITRPNKTIVLADTRFLLTISITLAAYISLAIVITKLIFFKKKKLEH